ncbi:MAG: beta strand repeat-containing protein, partial [Candidatus Competibacterales bacterium]
GIEVAAGEVLVADDSRLDATTGDGAGRGIRVAVARGVTIRNGGIMVADVTGSGVGGALTVEAETLTIAGRGAGDTTGLQAVVAPEAMGAGGDVNLAVGVVTVADGLINVSTLGPGPGGNLVIDASQVVVDTTEGAGPFTFVNGVQVSSFGPGPGGDLSIFASEVEVLGGSKVSTDNFGAGPGGDLLIEADRVLTDGRDLGTVLGPISTASGYITASPQPQASGDGGNLTVRADYLEFRGDSGLVVTTNGSGNAGDLLVEGGTMIIDDDNQGNFNTGMSNAAFFGASGNGGTMTLRLERLEVRAGGTITTSTLSSGNAGNIIIEADSVLIDGGTTPVGATNISTTTFPGSSGQGGNLTVTAREVTLTNGGVLSTATFGPGEAGILTVVADDLTLADNGFLSTSTLGAGRGGDLNVSAGRLTATGGTIRADAGTAFSLSPIPPGPTPPEGFGDAGDIRLTVDETLLLAAGGAVLSTADQSGGGRLQLRGDLIQLRDGAQISASVQEGADSGGDIALEANTLVALGDSNITARADQGFGGNITLGAEVFLRGDGVVIDASSNVVGNAGEVVVNAPELDITAGLAALAVAFFDAAATLQGRCGAPEDSRFGVQGLAAAPAPGGVQLSSGVLDGVLPLDPLALQTEVAPGPLVALGSNGGCGALHRGG